MTEGVDTIRGILTDTSNRMQHIRSIQFLAWNTPDEIPEKYAEVVQELAVDLDYYEPDVQLRSEAPEYYDDAELERRVMQALELFSTTADP